VLALLYVINDILDLSKIESGKMEIKEEPLNLRTSLIETYEVFHAESRSKSLELTYDIDPAIPECIIGDESRLRQVLINLVGNAVKFTEQGGVHVSVAVLSRAEEQLELEFRVSDTGIGIPEEKRSLLFQPFTQVDSSLTRKYGGTGLGLAICKNLVQLMGGRIALAPGSRRGAEFVFTIRVKGCVEYDCMSAIQ
ncbi:histidine kinase, partial [Paenibacillus sp. A3]|uniref:ATP-binding protein n=1 Tax=Paenibacillus sp. A3 TaxID=1337054 RepID=UPI0006E57993